MEALEPVLSAFEMTSKLWIRLAGTVVEIVGVAVIIAGLLVTAYRFLRNPPDGTRYEGLRTGIGRSILLGIEILLAADIIKTIVFDVNLVSLAALGLLILIRTFLSWSLIVEIEHRWPWQR